MSVAVRSLAACVLLAALVATVVGRPADAPLTGVVSSSDVMPSTTLLAQDLEMLAQPFPTPTKGQSVDRPVRASPLAHIIADVIDIKYQIGRAFLSRFFSLFPQG